MAAVTTAVGITAVTTAVDITAVTTAVDIDGRGMVMAMVGVLAVDTDGRGTVNTTVVVALGEPSVTGQALLISDHRLTET